MSSVQKQRSRLFSLVAFLVCLPSVAAASPSQPDPGAEVYRKACVSCHGVHGTGRPQNMIGFDVSLPDFTDCNFASREPNADWASIVSEGGPIRGFDEMMPAFGEALTWEEIGQALNHLRSFCRADDWPRGELNLPRPLFTEKAYPEDEVVWTTGVATEGEGAVANELVYEKRFGARNQFEASVPVDFQKGGSGDWNGGIGDVAIGVKRAVFHRLSSGSIFSVAGEVVLPTGNEDKGLGKGVTVFEPFVSFGQILPADGFVHFQGGVELPVDTQKATNEAFWRFVIGKSLVQGRFGRAWSPMLEVLGFRELTAGEPTHWDLVPQVQVTLNTRQHIMANVGVRFPVNDTASRDTTFLVYLLWDWFDGGLFEAW